MSAELVFIHGRSQEGLNPTSLKRQWVEALRAGLEKSGRELTLDDTSIHFAYYGQAVFDYMQGVSPAADVIVMGEDEKTTPELPLQAAIMSDVRQELGITDEDIAEQRRLGYQEMGPLNWGWVQAVLELIDQRLPGGSAAAIGLFTRDVHLYLRYPGLRDIVEAGVRKAIKPETPTVVVSHSLGSVVAYSLLRREGTELGWNIPLFVTLGSPLQVGAIRKAFAPNKFPECVAAWYNAMDPRDVVSLYPLSGDSFPGPTAIENKTDVDNPHPDRHAIEGYLTDPDVAARIHEKVRN